MGLKALDALLNPTWQLALNLGIRESLIDKHNVSVIIDMSDCSSYRLIKCLHAKVFVKVITSKSIARIHLTQPIKVSFLLLDLN